MQEKWREQSHHKTEYPPRFLLKTIAAGFQPDDVVPLYWDELGDNIGKESWLFALGDKHHSAHLANRLFFRIVSLARETYAVFFARA